MSAPVLSPRRRSLVILLVAVAVVAAGATWSVVRFGGLPALKVNHPVRVTLAGGCPARVVGDDGVVNPDSSNLEQLVPRGPTGGLVCAYTSSAPSASAGTAAHTKALTLAEATLLAADLDGIDDVSAGEHSCPGDYPAFTVVVFSYADREDVDTWYERGSCGGVNNGYVSRGYLTTPVVAQFQQLDTDLDKIGGRTLYDAEGRLG